MLDYEDDLRKSGYSIIIGIDEAGRAPLAGPVVASAVSLKSHNFQNKICDSKKLSPRQREVAFHEIMDKAYVGVGIISEAVIDQINILQSTFLAMHNAVTQLLTKIPPDLKNKKDFDQKVYMLIDGDRFRCEHPFKYQTIIKGDDKVLSIACASIIAKVMRDRILTTYDQIFPVYGFKQHKGYPTVKHKQAIKEYGPSIIHRMSFKH